ncbi:MAG TPA: hypothetical protein VFG83_16775 [Kofleriaceae bacterium]|nr:hypothetical protein [Kofleriaceae bacterium]
MSSPRKTTPGPWRVEDCESTYPYEVVSGEAPCDDLVCADATQADAHLIAAAPDLYGALERVRPLVAASVSGTPDRSMLDVIDAALAKARGER